MSGAVVDFSCSQWKIGLWRKRCWDSVELVTVLLLLLHFLGQLWEGSYKGYVLALHVSMVHKRALN
jgi:hypothetical protein